MQFDVYHNLYCNVRDDGWLDSFTPLKLRKMRMSKTDYFVKGSLACAQQGNRIKWEENNLWLGIFNLCPLCENASRRGQSEMPIDTLKLGQVYGGTCLPLSIMAIRPGRSEVHIVQPFETRQNHGLNNSVAFTN